MLYIENPKKAVIWKLACVRSMMHSLASRFKSTAKVDGKVKAADEKKSNGLVTGLGRNGNGKAEESENRHRINGSNGKVSSSTSSGMSAALQASPAKPPTPHRIVRPPRLVPAEEIDHDSAEGRRHFYEHVCFLISKKLGVMVCS